MKGPILGWDVGGANIKAARLGEDGRSEPKVLERAFPLWREPHRLPAVLVEAADQLGGARSMAVTMTAELADCFATKREGVAFVLDAFRTAFPDVEPWVYGVDGRFRSAEAARQRPLEVAAANWMASATLVARTFPDAIFLDVGSTTTDVIPIVAGRVAVRGRTDPARLRSGRARLHRSAAHAGLRHRALGAPRWPPVPRGGRALRSGRRRPSLAGTDRRERLHLRDAGRPGPKSAEAGARLARMVCADLEMLGPATSRRSRSTWRAPRCGRSRRAFDR